MRRPIHLKLAVAALTLVFVAPSFTSGSDANAELPPIRTVGPGDRAKTLGEVEEVARRFEETSKEFNSEMKSMVLREMRRRRQFLQKSYGKRIDDVDVVQRARRIDAIAALEQFIERYPSHKKHTPDAMFRLAELYFEKSQVDNEGLSMQYDRDLDRYERGKLASEPIPPRENFAEAVKLYDEVIRRFPKYRFSDVAYYMKGYMMFRSGKDRESKDAWQILATRYPKSKYASEAWLRVGEYHFDFGEWRLAERAYSMASKDPDGKFYAMALYKLAWTHFNQYDYDRAIKGFTKLISSYSKNDSKPLASALRVEAIQYLGRSLAEDDWDGDGEVDANAGVDRALSYLSDGGGYELEILEEYAKALYELHEKRKYAEAAAVYRRLIDRDALNPRNPELHERLVESFDLAGDMLASASERDELVRRYGRDTDWYKANIANVKATTRADRLVEAGLRQRAKFHHVRAQNLKIEGRAEDDPAKMAAARAAYLKAAEAYQSYLTAYPHRREAYEIRFLLAEALYYAERFPEAADAYAEVRDAKGNKKYREVSGFSAISSTEQEMERLVKAKKLDKKALAEEADMPDGDDKQGTKIRRAKPLALPDVVAPWVEHSDTYMAMKLSRKDVPDFPIQQSYRVALMYFNYRHFEEARKRFQEIIAKWPLKQEAAFAAMNLINSYKLENDWKNIEMWTDKIAKQGIGRPEDVAALQRQLADFKLGQQFDRAVALYAEKRYVEAAEEFERIVNKDSKSKVADKALFNAAMAYQNAKRWNSAARVFERVATESRFKGSKFREDALYYMAKNNHRFFAFDKAVRLYLSLARSFPKSKRVHYATYTAAELQEMQGNLTAAAELYRQYAKDYSKRDDAAQALFAAGLVYEKMNDASRQISLWKEFIGRHSKTPGTDGKIVDANLRLGDLYKDAGNWPGAKKYYEATIEEFESRGLQPGSPIAAFAAKARFELVDYGFRRYEKMKLEGSLARQGKTIQAKRAMQQKLEGEFVRLFEYRAFGWTLAGLYRIGQLYELFAKMLYSAPDPNGLDDEGMDMYRTMIEDEGLKWENVAIQRYEKAVENARKLKIVNEWTMSALASLNRYKPQKYPLFKSEKRAYDFGIGYLVPLSPPVPKAAVEPEGSDAQGDPDEPKSPDAPQPDGTETPDGQPGTQPTAAEPPVPGDVPATGTQPEGGAGSETPAPEPETPAPEPTDPEPEVPSVEPEAP
ncbi:MAG: TolA-binding protein [Myxococcota bacterium]|jgi:TolA-binding protein